MKNFNKFNFNRGFTIIETLVAISILMLSIVGPLTVSQKSLSASLYAKDQVIASFLAQDAMEYLKNIRDGEGYSDLMDTVGGCIISNPCNIDTIENKIASCPLNGDCEKLYIKDGEGYTTASNGNNTIPSIFRRVFYVDTINISNSGEEANFIVKVTWQNGTIKNHTVLEDQFFDIIR